jgi:hypothetical protein
MYEVALEMLEFIGASQHGEAAAILGEILEN